MTLFARSTIRAGGVDRVVGALLTAPMVAAAGAAGLMGAQPDVPPSWRFGSWVAVAFALAAAPVLYRLLSGPVGPLRIKVSDETVELRQRGRPPAVFWRTDIEMLVVDEGFVTRTRSLSVYGPDRCLLDRWETGWITKSTRNVMRALERHGFPHDWRDGGGGSPARPGDLLLERRGHDRSRSSAVIPLP